MSRGQPTLADFQTFITQVMGVPTQALDLNSAVVAYSFDFALDWVYQGLCAAGGGARGGWTIYQRAVYNLAADTLINWAQDPDPPYIPTNTGGVAYWAYLRAQFGVGSFVPGVISSTSDEGTSESLVVPEAFKELTIANLGNLKTPYGRTYLGLVQSWGPVWGLS